MQALKCSKIEVAAMDHEASSCKILSQSNKFSLYP